MGTTFAPHSIGRRVAAVIVLSVALVPMGSAQGEVVRGTESPLAAARRTREAAESHLARLITTRERLDARLRSGRGAGVEIVEAIAAARRDLRQNAVEAYIAGGESEQLSLVLTAEDPTEIADRVNFTGHRVVNAADALGRFEQLKRDNDPAVVALAQRLDTLDVAIADARDALYQAAANEADAERVQRVESAAQSSTSNAVSTTVGSPAPVDSTPSPRAVTTPSGSRRSDPPAPTATAPSTTQTPPTTAVADTVPIAASFTAPGSYSPSGSGPSAEAWAALRNCEAGGNYSAVSGSGRYRGAYQFDRSTWESLGGTGDPAAASPADQDLAAAVLYSMRGSRAWPGCGSALG